MVLRRNRNKNANNAQQPTRMSLWEKYKSKESIIGYTALALLGAVSYGYQMGPSIQEGLRVIDAYIDEGRDAGHFMRALGRIGMAFRLTPEDAEQAIVLFDRFGDRNLYEENQIRFDTLKGASLGAIALGLAGAGIVRGTEKRKLKGKTAQNSLAVNLGERFLLRTNREQERIFRKAT